MVDQAVLYVPARLEEAGGGDVMMLCLACTYVAICGRVRRCWSCWMEDGNVAVDMWAAMDAMRETRRDSPEVRGPWPVLSAISCQVLHIVILARVVVWLWCCCWFGLVRHWMDGWLGWMGNGSQHMTIGAVCYR